jgi:hypothetical protein
MGLSLAVALLDLEQRFEEEMRDLDNGQNLTADFEISETDFLLSNICLQISFPNNFCFQSSSDGPENLK